MDEMSDEDIQALIELGIIPEQQQALQGQLEQAQLLRDKSLAGPEMRGNHRVQTAANPLEFLVSGIQGYRAGKDIKSLQEQQAALLRQQATGRNKFIQSYLDTPERRASRPFMQDVPVDEFNMPVGNY